MSNLILPASCRNVQLAESERTCVYRSTITGRILGFGHESMAPMFREGWTREVLYHASAIEKWAEKYRKQEEEDRQEEDFRKTEREAPARNAIRQALIARRDQVDAGNRAYIDANLKLMDQRAERARNRKEQAYLLCEKYEGDPRPEDIALESPAFKEG
jgi:hypothetical protein